MQWNYNVFINIKNWNKVKSLKNEAQTPETKKGIENKATEKSDFKEWQIYDIL